jgi:hypothetical protein
MAAGTASVPAAPRADTPSRPAAQPQCQRHMPALTGKKPQIYINQLPVDSGKICPSAQPRKSRLFFTKNSRIIKDFLPLPVLHFLLKLFCLKVFQMACCKHLKLNTKKVERQWQYSMRRFSGKRAAP